MFTPPAPAPRRTAPDLFDFLYAARTNPLTTWTEAHFQELTLAGDGVLGRVTVTSDPLVIRHVLVDNAASYRKDDLQRRVLAPGVGDGILTAEGDEWKRHRRTLAPLFTPRNVTGFGADMQGAAERMLRRWERWRPGRIVDVRSEMTRVTLDVLERTIFTRGLPRDPDALGRAITRFFDAVGPIDPLDVFGMPNWIPRLGRIRARPALRFFEDVVGELITTRRELLAKGMSAPRDLLTLLLEAADPETRSGLDDIAVRANIVTFIGAGHETTAIALSWALYLLSQSPATRERVEAEVDEHYHPEASAGSWKNLPFTRAVIEEAMRLYPPVPIISRAAVKEDRIGNLKIPRGSMVMIAPYVLHRHQRLWSHPDAFIPDRFLPGRRESIDRFAYLPFGAGPRVCIGASFSLQEAIIVLANIVRRFRADLAEGHVVEPVHRITLRPKGGLPMRLTPRCGPI